MLTDHNGHPGKPGFELGITPSLHQKGNLIMPQLQNLVLKDRATTPVDHTFTPRDVVGNVGTVVETGGVPIGNSVFSVSLRQTAGGRYKGTLKGVFPVVATETINGVSQPKVVRVARATIEFDFDPTSSEAERNNVVGMMSDALGTSKVLVNDTIVKLQGVY